MLSAEASFWMCPEDELRASLVDECVDTGREVGDRYVKRVPPILCGHYRLGRERKQQR